MRMETFIRKSLGLKAHTVVAVYEDEALRIDSRARSGQAPARRCLDWTERRPHIAGPVGTALANLAFDRGWIRRLGGTRAVVVTPRGRAQRREIFNVRWEETTR